MGASEQPLKIIGNESNQVYEIEPGHGTKEQMPAPSAQEQQTNKEHVAEELGNAPQQPSNDLATNDGSIVETLDTAFHQKPGVAESENPSGSNRADYYELRSNGQTDAEEEIDGAGPA